MENKNQTLQLIKAQALVHRKTRERQNRSVRDTYIPAARAHHLFVRDSHQRRQQTPDEANHERNENGFYNASTPFYNF